MSNHNLFIHGADGAARPATTEQILAAARQALAHRVRRGASLELAAEGSRVFDDAVRTPGS